MGTDQNEFGRVLANPDNVILSDDLYDALDDDSLTLTESSTDNSTSASKYYGLVLFDEESFPCEIKEITRQDYDSSDSVFKFVLFVSDLPIDVILNKNSCVLKVGEHKFCQLDHSHIKWMNSCLIIKARRILK